MALSSSEQVKLNGQSPPPPPRPPPPRSMPRRRPAPPTPVHPAASAKSKGMPRRSVTKRPAPPAPTTPTAAPAPTGPGPSRQVSVAKLSPSTSGVSSTRAPPSRPPARPKNPDLEALRCHIALDDETIARALSRARLPSCPPPPDHVTSENNTGSPIIRCQRFSDASTSTSSSDSLDSSQTPGFSLPALPPHQNQRRPVEDSSEDEEEGEEDYGVGLEADLEMRLRPSFRLRGRKVGVALSGGPFIVPKALKGRFRKMSGVLSAMVTPERRLVKRIAELSRDRDSYFGSLVQDYISFVQENRSCHATGLDLLQTLRQFLTQMKAYLRQSSELDPPIEALIPEEQIDQLLEKAMHKCVLKPLKGVVDVALHSFQVNSGALQQLQDNLVLVKTRGVQDLGVEGVVVPDAAAVEKIRHKFLKMKKMYSPEKKVSVLLNVCKRIYSIMQKHSGRMLGADHFLPVLTLVLTQCDMPELDSEIQYMMELLDPSLLQGEGGYYLTSAYGSMALIRNFGGDQAGGVLSPAVRDTLQQWHRRRTAPRVAPSVDDLQSVLRVALQEVTSGCAAMSVGVHPFTTTEEVCRACAFQLQVVDPENYSLFLVTPDTRQQLAPDTHPQRIEAAAAACHFLYRSCKPRPPTNQLEAS